MAIVVLGLAFAGTAGAERYVVLYKHQHVPEGPAFAVARAGGTVVASYPEIGVVVAEASSTSFAANIERHGRIDGIAATDSFAASAESGFADAGAPDGDLPNEPATDTDTFSPLQWNMRQIQAPEAHAVTGGSPAVVVGHIDTGIDATHLDLAQNVDFADSVSCVGGVPNQNPAAWDDDSGHGTHTAGIIAAASNGIGVVGVAPNVKIAAIKASVRSEGRDLFFADAVVCALMWAADRGLDVTNNSYFVDPFRFNCRNEEAQRVIVKAVQRAARYAMQRGVTVVASMGNENTDLAHPPLGNRCVKLPVELPGVIGVSANGNLRQKGFYSSYGVGVVDVVAPGGDPFFQRTPEAPNGAVLSTWPAKFGSASRVIQDCSLGPCAFYRYDFGTSMAAAHVTGVAALVISRFGDSGTPENGALRPGQVRAFIDQTADRQPCPPNPFAPTPFPPGPAIPTVAVCQGGEGYNGFYGHGQVNALRAVTHDTGR